MLILLHVVLACVFCRIGGRPVNATWAEPKKNEDTSQVTIREGSASICRTGARRWLYISIAMTISTGCEYKPLTSGSGGRLIKVF